MKLTKELAELIGIIIGDGNIYYNRRLRKYYFEITGHPNLDREYFSYISNLIYNLLDKKPSITIRDRGLRLRIYSKEFVEFLIKDLEMPYGRIKGEIIKIPKKIKTWDLIKPCLRGIVDTDGSVFVAKKSRAPNYPSIEITTASIILANQIRNKLLKKGFRVAKIWKYQPKNKNYRLTYKVPLNGKENIKMWLKEIGFSNPYKLKRAINYIK